MEVLDIFFPSVNRTLAGHIVWLYLKYMKLNYTLKIYCNCGKSGNSQQFS